MAAGYHRQADGVWSMLGHTLHSEWSSRWWAHAAASLSEHFMCGQITRSSSPWRPGCRTVDCHPKVKNSVGAKSTAGAPWRVHGMDGSRRAKPNWLPVLRWRERPQSGRNGGQPLACGGEANSRGPRESKRRAFERFHPAAEPLFDHFPHSTHHFAPSQTRPWMGGTRRAAGTDGGAAWRAGLGRVGWAEGLWRAATGVR